MDYRRLGRTALRVSELCLGTMNFGPETRRTSRTRSWTARSSSASTSSTPPTATAAATGRARPSRSSAAGSRRAAAGARRSCSPPRSTARCPTGRTTGGCPRGTSARPATPACAGCRPTTSTSTRCTTSTGTRRGTRSGRRWTCSSQQGKVIYVGSSNFAGWHIAQANERGQARGSLGLVSEQSLYNLLVRTVELEVLPACRDYGLGVIPWSPLAAGCSAACSSNESTSRRQLAQRPRADREAAAAAREVGGALRRARRGAGRRRAGLAAPAARGHLPDHRAAHDGPARRCLAARPRPQARRRQRWRRSTRSSPAPAAPPPRPTPGKPVGGCGPPGRLPPNGLRPSSTG